jgi:hypothetical protein
MRVIQSSTNTRFFGSAASLFLVTAVRIATRLFGQRRLDTYEIEVLDRLRLAILSEHLEVPLAWASTMCPSCWG